MKKRGHLLILLFILSLCGCGGKNYDKNAASLQEDTVSESEHDLITVGYAQIGSESDWRLANTESFKNEFTEENGYYLIFEDGQQKQENQLKAMRSFILQEVDYIILDPIVESGWESILEEAKTAGIPVILTDRFVDVKNEDLYTCWVGSDFWEEGRKAGRWLEDYLKSQGREQEEIRMVTLQGSLGSTAQIGRTEGFAEILSTHDNWKMLALESADFTQTKGQEVMKELLEKYENLNVVICENDNMAFGAIKAMEEAGIRTGKDGEILVISFDAVMSALQMVMEGKISADFECNPLLGPEISDIIRTLEQGENVDKNRYVKETYFDFDMDLTTVISERAY